MPSAIKKKKKVKRQVEEKKRTRAINYAQAVTSRWETIYGNSNLKLFTSFLLPLFVDFIFRGKTNGLIFLSVFETAMCLREAPHPHK